MMVHIDQEAYCELQRQIQDAVDSFGDETHKNISAIAILQDCSSINLAIEMSTQTSRTKFTDGAWGITQRFTEITWRCDCKIVKASVCDRERSDVESDFDESQLDLKFEVTDWK